MTTQPPFHHLHKIWQDQDAMIRCAQAKVAREKIWANPIQCAYKRAALAMSRHDTDCAQRECETASILGQESRDAIHFKLVKLLNPNGDFSDEKDLLNLMSRGRQHRARNIPAAVDPSWKALQVDAYMRGYYE